MLATFATHFLQYNFLPPGEAWFRGAAWPNVAAMVPCGVVLWLYLRSRHLAVMESHAALVRAHVAHAEQLDLLLNKLDPQSDGGLGTIKDMLMLDTPGGLAVLDEKLSVLVKAKARTGRAVE